MHILVNRRGVLAAAVAAPVIDARPAFAASSLDLSDPDAVLKAYARLVGDGNGGTVLRWHTGVVNAIEPGKAPRPLVGYDGMEKEIWTVGADGTFATTYFDIGYFKDLTTGTALSRWENLLTGAKVTPMAFRSGRYTATLSAANFDRRPEVRGDDVWFSSAPTVTFPSLLKPDAYPAESPGPMQFFSVAKTDRGRVSELSDPAISNAVLAWSYALSTVWLPWMQMGQRPGGVTWNGVGGKYRDVGQVPASFRTFLDGEQPNYLTAAEPWRDVRTMWSDYMRAHPPAARP